MIDTPAGAPLRIAHGYGNSRKLVEIALDEDRIDLIETDVRLRGGRLWLAHDRRLFFWWHLRKRAGWGLLFQRHAFRVEDLAAAVAGKCELLLDLKGPLLAGNRRRFLEALLAILRRFDHAAIRLCGDWVLLDEVRRTMPELKLYYSVADRRRWRAFVRRVDQGDPIHGVSLRARLLDASTARFLRAKGIEILCWPVESDAEAARVVALGAAGIISYDLDVLGGAAGESGC